LKRKSEIFKFIRKSRKSSPRGVISAKRLSKGSSSKLKTWRLRKLMEQVRADQRLLALDHKVLPEGSKVKPS